MTEPQQQDSRDWVDILVDLAALVGLNKVRVRWKLERLRERWRVQQRRGEQQVEHIRYRHKVCQQCGRVHDRDETVCTGCGARLGGWHWQLLHRIGLSLPTALSMSSLLGLAICAAFARLLAWEGSWEAILSFRVETLVHFGGNYPPAVWAGEWWRLGTAIFLHMGIWHIGFNLFALSQIGPPMEEVFGRGRMLLFFMLTGVVANLGSLLFGLHGVAIGASGAIMGLCGLAAGWGQRDATTIGRQVRNRMLKWTLYTMVFGFFIGADNMAHAVGFLSGGLIGFVARPDLLRRSGSVPVRVIQTVAGAVLAIGAVVLTLFPPSTSVNPPAQAQDPDDDYGLFIEMCLAHEAGDDARAQEIWDQRYSPTLTQRLMISVLSATAGDEAGPTGPPQVGTMCAGLRQQEQACLRFETEGLKALYGDGFEPQYESERIELERTTRSQCRKLLRALGSTPPASQPSTQEAAPATGQPSTQ